MLVHRRQELTVLERAEHLARRKQIYELLHPETRRGVAQALGMHRALGHNVARTERVTSFTEDTAAKTGLHPSTIWRDVQIAEHIAADVRDAIRDTPLADAKRGEERTTATVAFVQDIKARCCWGKG